MGVFFKMKWFLGKQGVRVPCLDIKKGWCNIHIDGTIVFGWFFWIKSDECVVTIVTSYSAAQQVCIVKTDNVMPFSNVAPPSRGMTLK